MGAINRIDIEADGREHIYKEGPERYIYLIDEQVYRAVEGILDLIVDPSEASAERERLLSIMPQWRINKEQPFTKI